jgi:hypothetical protein
MVKDLYFIYLIYSHIWINISMDDSHFSFETFTKKLITLVGGAWKTIEFFLIKNTINLV